MSHQYAIAKNKIQLTPEINVDKLLKTVKEKYMADPAYAEGKIALTDIDGVKIDFPDSWVHLRKSNTEPIIRIYSEAHSMEEAEHLAEEIRKVIASLA